MTIGYRFVIEIGKLVGRRDLYVYFRRNPDFRNVHIPKDLFSLSIFHCSLHQILLVVDCHFIEYVFLR